MSSLAAAAPRPLPLRRREDLVVVPMDFRGERYWGVKDPVTLRYFHLRDEEYTILRLLDGALPLSEIRSRFERQFAPRVLAHAELESFLGMLHDNGLILTDTPGQSATLLQRADRTRRRALWRTLTNLLAIRFRGFDPEPVLRGLAPVANWLFTPVCLVAGALFVLLTLLFVALQAGELSARMPSFQAVFNAGNLPWFIGTIAVCKILHELGHALVCRRLGGECHEMGVLLLLGTPCLYCNVSDAWMLPDKWQRIAISAAGIGVELLLAATCTWLWWFSVPGLFNALCFNVMMVCSINTLLFNGNPLLKYDGYYILADACEIPNLQQQAADSLQRLCRRGLLADETSPYETATQSAAWLPAYAVLSLGYRWLVAWAVLLFCYRLLAPTRLEWVFPLVAMVGLAGLVVAPVYQFVRFVRDLAARPGFRRKRAAAVAILVFGVLLLPFPCRVKAPVFIQPVDAERVYVSVAGRLIEAVAPGTRVEAGARLAKLENLEVTADVDRLRGEVNQHRVRRDHLQRRQITEPAAAAQLPAVAEALQNLEQRLQQRENDQKRLDLRSSRDGTVIPLWTAAKPDSSDELLRWRGTPLEPENRGCTLQTGTLLCLVGDPRRTEAVVIIDEADLPLVRVGQQVRIQLEQTPGNVLRGTIRELAAHDMESIPRELLGTGELAARIQGGTATPLTKTYQARVELEGQEVPLQIGAPGRAKIVVAPQSLVARVRRFLDRTFRP